MIPIVTFKYQSLAEYSAMNNIILTLSLYEDNELTNYMESYHLHRTPYNLGHYECDIQEILYSDIANVDYFKNKYDRCIKEHGYDKVSKLVVQDPYKIKQKIVNAINYVFDTVCDEGEIIIDYYAEGYSKPKSSIPELIYSALSTYFEITRQVLDQSGIQEIIPRVRVIKIKRRDVK